MTTLQLLAAPPCNGPWASLHPEERAGGGTGEAVSGPGALDRFAGKIGMRQWRFSVEGVGAIRPSGNDDGPCAVPVQRVSSRFRIGRWPIVQGGVRPVFVQNQKPGAGDERKDSPYSTRICVVPGLECEACRDAFEVGEETPVDVRAPFQPIAGVIDGLRGEGAAGGGIHAV